MDNANKTPEEHSSEKVSDFIIRHLAGWDISPIFGYPGDGINGIVGALSHSMEDIKFTQVRHQEMAALMACAHAKFTEEVGVWGDFRARCNSLMYSTSTNGM